MMELKNLENNITKIDQELNYAIEKLCQVTTAEEKVQWSLAINNLSTSLNTIYTLYFETMDIDDDLYFEDDE